MNGLYIMGRYGMLMAVSGSTVGWKAGHMRMCMLVRQIDTQIHNMMACFGCALHIDPDAKLA